MSEGVHCVWFKRDLRVFDHAPLAKAVRAGRVLPVYRVEPDRAISLQGIVIHELARGWRHLYRFRILKNIAFIKIHSS
jgi:deoxyribodipyrimidine photolyase